MEQKQTSIRISNKIKKELDELKQDGGSYQTVIRQLLTDTQNQKEQIETLKTNNDLLKYNYNRQLDDLKEQLYKIEFIDAMFYNEYTDLYDIADELEYKTNYFYILKRILDSLNNYTFYNDFNDDQLTEKEIKEQLYEDLDTLFYKGPGGYELYYVLDCFKFLINYLKGTPQDKYLKEYCKYIKETQKDLIKKYNNYKKDHYLINNYIWLDY